MDRITSVVLFVLGTLVTATSALAAQERWKCVVTIEVRTLGREAHASHQLTISDTEVTSRAISILPSAPLIHYKIIENSDDGLMAVTNDSYRTDFDGATRDATLIALDKRSGDFVESAVYLSEKLAPGGWSNRGECNRN
jgi:hypothetical protein